MQLQILVCCAAASAGIVSVSRGDVVGYVLDYSNSTEELDIVRIYALFDTPTDKLTNCGDYIIDTFGTNGFYQHPLGLDTPPPIPVLNFDPTVALDSYVTIGAVNDGSPSDINVDPDFDSIAFNSAGQVQGGWYNAPPTLGSAGSDGLVLIAQLSIDADDHPGFSGPISFYWYVPGGHAIATRLYISGPLQLDAAGPSNSGLAGDQVIEYTVTNSHSEQWAIGLSAGLSLGGIAPLISDQSNEVTVAIAPEITEIFSRLYQQPQPGVIAGPYMNAYGIHDLDANGSLAQAYRIQAESEAALHVSQPRFGVTVLIHGSNPGSDQEMAVLADAIIERANNGTVLSYEPDAGAWQYMSGSLNPDEELVLLFNWPEGLEAVVHGAPCDVSPISGVSGAAAEALWAAIKDPILPLELQSVDLLADGIQFIGDLRGTVVQSETIRRAGLDGVPVHHSTMLHPLAYDGSGQLPDADDPIPRVWSNVLWAENYYFDHVCNASTSTTVPMSGAYNYVPHGDGLLWYRGTIDCSMQVSIGLSYTASTAAGMSVISGLTWLVDRC